MKLLAGMMVGVLLLAACQPNAPEAKADHVAIAVDTEGRVTANRNGKPMTEAELQALLSTNNTGTRETKP